MQVFRELKISLAAKCQLLFGVAVALIIAAALFAPWQRMEQLTDELDRHGALQLTEHVLAEHIVVMRERAATRSSETTASTRQTGTEVPATQVPTMDAPTTEVPTTEVPTVEVRTAEVRTTEVRTAEVRSMAVPLGSTRPAAGPGSVRFGAGATTQGIRMAAGSFFLPRLTAAGDPDLTATERRALLQFAERPADNVRLSYYTRRDSTHAYRYTRAVYARGECLSCHSAQREKMVTVTVPGKGTEAGTTFQLPPGLIGTVTVDLASQRETNQVLLNRMFFLGAGLGAGALAIVVFSLITGRFILQPVRVLQETAAKVSEGDLGIRSHIGSGDEFQLLSETINTMLANLQTSEEQLRSANRSLDAKLEQLNETNIALAETNRLKSEFLANVSHELRTPLNSILGFAELLRKGSEHAADARSTRYATNIHASGTNLLTLINDLLDLAKVEAGRMEVRPAEFTLGELFESLVSVLKPLTEPKQITVTAEVETPAPTVTPPIPPGIDSMRSDAELPRGSEVAGVGSEHGGSQAEKGASGPAASVGASSAGGSSARRDASRPGAGGVPILVQDASKVQQILYNFMSNAIKYSPMGGEILLRAVMEDPDHVRISVRDDGPGIEPDKQRAIFEKFRQLDGGVTRTHGGTGLGLAISKELTALLGGRIGIESNVGEGATFFVILPVRIDAQTTEVRRGGVSSPD